MPTPPRGTLVLDIGSTNTKLVLFDGAGRPLRERRVESRHVPGPPYRSLDPEPALALLAEALPDFDAELPVDVIVPCAHGSALALLDEARRARLAGDGLFRRAAGRDRRRLSRDRAALRGSVLPDQSDGADARAAAVLAGDPFPGAVRPRPHHPAMGPVFRLAHERPRGDGPYRARRADPARRRHRQPLLVAGARARLGSAVRAACRSLRDAGNAEARAAPLGARRAARDQGRHPRFQRQLSALPRRRARRFHAAVDRHLDHRLRHRIGFPPPRPEPRYRHQHRPVLAPGRLQPLHGRAGDRRGRGRRADRVGHAGGAFGAGPARHLRLALLHRFGRPDARHRRARQDRRAAAARPRRSARRWARSIAR